MSQLIRRRAARLVAVLAACGGAVVAGAPADAAALSVADLPVPVPTASDYQFMSASTTPPSETARARRPVLPGTYYWLARCGQWRLIAKWRRRDYGGVRAEAHLALLTPQASSPSQLRSGWDEVANAAGRGSMSGGCWSGPLPLCAQLPEVLPGYCAGGNSWPFGPI